MGKGTSQTISFGQGVDSKTDPFKIQPGKMQSLRNTVFNKGGLLEKRNGFGNLPSVGDSESRALSTYNDALVAIGNSIKDFSSETGLWTTKGSYQQVSLDTLPVVRNSENLTAQDVSVASNGLSCAVFLGSSSLSYYQIFDSITGQVVVASVALPSTATNPRVFFLGRYFIITFMATVSAATHLQYISIQIASPQSSSAATDLSTAVSGLSAGYDGFVANNNLYFAWDANTGGGAVKVSFIDSSLVQHGTITITGHTSDLMSVCADITQSTPVVYVTYWNSSNDNAYTSVYNQNLVQITAPIMVINNKALRSITSSAGSGSVSVIYEQESTYSFSSVPKDIVVSIPMTQAGSISAPLLISNSGGLASKSFFLPLTGKTYVLVAYGASTTYSSQPSYFLMDTTQNIVAKLAYSNGSGYVTTQVLTGASVYGGAVFIGYLFKDLIIPVNKGVAANQSSGIYNQNGVNLATFTFNGSQTITSEIGNDLHLTGGLLSMYDGMIPVEHGFNLYPENFNAVWADTGGSIAAKPDGSTNTNAYYYQVTYEWTDAKGNIHRSAPSVPLGVTTTGSGTAGSITLHIPTLLFTARTMTNPMRIVIYRWSVAQQSFYQVTPIIGPTINDTTQTSVTFTDMLADASIIGNELIYTTGGVIENIGAPATDAIALFKSRLFLIDSEDRNLLWYSKQVVESTPVEMSDLLSRYVAPTTGTQGSTGPMRCISAMDDKLIIFKDNAIYYITGNGPDITGANDDFSDPVFITSAVGCSDQNSIALIPTGIQFKSNKGIWLLGRDLSTRYIGADVEDFNAYDVTSAVTIPGTNQVRFSLSSGSTLMYDYYYSQWGEFVGVPAISSVIYQGLQTILNSDGSVLQETPGKYIDGSNPVLISFVTGWLNFAGIRGYERLYEFSFLGTYLSPHKLAIQVAYDYGSPSHQSIYAPNNYSPAYGVYPIYGGPSPYGGPSDIESFRVFAKQQKCKSFQISVQEVYDSTLGVAAGAGVSLSGINFVIALKKAWAPTAASKSVG